MAAYLRGHRIDLRAIAGELGLARATIYRWFGSREGLIAQVLNRAADAILDQAAAGQGGRGAAGLLDTFDAFNRSLSTAPALRAFVAAEGAAAVRVITSSTGAAHAHNVGRIAELIQAEADAGTYAPAVEPATLAYAIVRLAEAFLLNDAGDMPGDVERLRTLEAALLGVDP